MSSSLIMIGLSTFAIIYATVGLLFIPLPLTYGALGWVMATAIHKVIDEIKEFRRQN